MTQTRAPYRFGQNAVARLGLSPGSGGPGVAFCAEVDRIRAAGQTGSTSVMEAAKAFPESHRAYIQACGDAKYWAQERCRYAGPDAQALGDLLQEVVLATGASVQSALAAIDRTHRDVFDRGVLAIYEWRRRKGQR